MVFVRLGFHFPETIDSKQSAKLAAIGAFYAFIAIDLTATYVANSTNCFQ